MKAPLSAKFIGTISFFVNSTRKSSLNSPKFLLQISRFSKYFSNAATAYYPSRRHEDESRNVRISVWWDFENCPVPTGANVFRIAQCITDAVRANGIKGPIHITAFGDVTYISRLNQEALSSTGIILTHIPQGGKNSADRSLLVDLMYWVSRNPPPAHIFLISGDRDFARILHRLRMNNYNILLASSENASSVLCSAASIMWHWNSLLKGENILGKHFNQPPDGPYGSWYGQYKAALEDPFAVSEQKVCAWGECLPDSGSDKLRSIPKTIVQEICHLLHSYPEGISLRDLRAELSKSNIKVDKSFFGYKRFSRFVSAMPHVLKLMSNSHGQIIVCGVPPRPSEQHECTPGVATEPIQNGKEHSALVPGLNSEKSSFIQYADEKPAPSLALETAIKPASKQQFLSAEAQNPQQQAPPSPESEMESPPDYLQNKSVHEKPQDVQETPAFVQGVDKAESSQGHLVKYHSVSEPGFFKRILRRWFGHKDVALEEKNGTAVSMISPGKLESIEKDVNSTTQQVESLSQSPFSPSGNEAVINNNKLKTSIADDVKSKRSSKFLSQILRFWRSSVVSDDTSEEVKGKMDQTVVHSENGLFAEESFWVEVKAFIDTPEGAAIVMQSRNRTQMAENLRKQGPRSLRSLSEADLLHLVKLIIRDKKWIEESLSEASPFKLIKSDEKASFSRPSSMLHNSNELSSIFSNKTQPSWPQKLQECDGHRRDINPSHAGASHPVTETKSSKKSRTVLDCQKLVHELLKEHPEGFNLGNFRKMFHKKYGYPLDMRQLGYEKLATFLKTMPGVTVESTYVFSSHNQESQQSFSQESNFGGTEVNNSESELSDGFRKDDDLDSPWEELGPLFNSRPKKSETQSGLPKKMKEEEKICNKYESLSDDDFSDTEEETSSEITSKGKKDSSSNGADSSLLQILDTWYKIRDDESKQSGSEDIDVVNDSSQSSSKVSSEHGGSEDIETPVRTTNGQKQKASKSYSFVRDQPVGNEDRLIDGMLGSLKKKSDKVSC